MHFNKAFIDFFHQLDENNNRDWFNENRKWYELAVREPFKALIDELLPEIHKLDPSIRMESKDAMFRINRDLRFSHEKEPYKTHMAAGFSRGGRKSQFAGYYLQIGLHHIVIGGGLPFIEKDVLRKIRIEIGYNTEEFQRILDNPEFRAYYGFVHGENRHEIPRSFSSIYEENPIIANKQFYYGALYDTKSWLFKGDLPELIINHYRAGQDFNQFLIRASSDFTQFRPGKTRKILEY
ncbi:MAG: DUF2461 domain-containing protein [Cytophagales bacterium]|nr:DUF2461 domain-containing protein [Cytophagales bacterium]